MRSSASDGDYRRRSAASPWWLLAAVSSACGVSLPSEVADYATRCAKLNMTEIPPHESDAHPGFKNVFACELDAAVVSADVRPFPEGALIVKESTRQGETAPWLVATARKQGGTWHWDEYTRSTTSEPLIHTLAADSVCTGCHRQALAVDWIFTRYTPR